MKIILIDQVRKLGDLGDIVNVSSGYARNFLIPQGKAKIATQKNKEEFEKIKSSLAQKVEQSTNAAQITAQQFENQEIKIHAQATEQGMLFGSIRPKTIAHAIQSQLNVDIKENQVDLISNIREIGKHTISIHLYGEIYVNVNLMIHPEKAF